MIFIYRHKGIWPVGACSAVVAVDEATAIEKLKEALAKHGIRPDRNGDFLIAPVEFDPNATGVTIILDGNY